MILYNKKNFNKKYNNKILLLFTYFNFYIFIMNGKQRKNCIKNFKSLKKKISTFFLSIFDT